MPSLRSITVIATAAAGLGAAAWCPAQDGPDELAAARRRIAELERQNQTLHLSLVESRRREKQNSEELASIRTRLEALGHNLLDGGDDRLVDAAADIEVLTDRVRRLETAATNLTAAVGDFLRQAVVSDPDARMRLETSMRELDAAIGLRDKPRPDLRTGSLQGARVISIDSRSGMLVLNVGENAGARIGMGFRLSRGERSYGRAIVADVREDLCGAFVEELDQEQEGVRIGDSATLATTQ
jgi:hypothetical protein